jgi:glucosamine--fructose-6-phosphate aminotransferase (isomerizing)
MLRETLEAPAVVERLVTANSAPCRELGQRLRRNPPQFVVTCARGSSDSAATYAKYLFEIALGVVTASVGPSVSSIYGARPHMANALFLAISQSGRSPDLLRLAEAARHDGALTVAIVNDAASPLASQCEIVLPMHAGPERSVAATKSHIASLAAILQLGALWSDHAGLSEALARLPGDLASAASADWSPAMRLLSDATNAYVVGRGPGFAAAIEAALKLKETSGLHAEAMSAAELMHGPLTLAGPRFPVILFSQADAAEASLAETVTSLTARGVPVIGAGPSSGQATVRLPTTDSVHPFAQPLTTILSFYRLAEALSRARNRDPDRPLHLSKVTETH